MHHFKRPEWHRQAACVDADPEIFFPHAGQDGHEAKEICNTCSVTTQCLEYALENDIPHGVWGGLTAPDRKYLRITGQRECMHVHCRQPFIPRRANQYYCQPQCSNAAFYWNHRHEMSKGRKNEEA